MIIIKEENRFARIQRVLERRKTQIVKNAIVKYDGKDFNAGYAIKDIENYMTDYMLGIAKPEIRINVPLSNAAKQELLSNGYTSHKLRILEKEHANHIVNKHLLKKDDIKRHTGHISFNEIKKIPEILLTTIPKFYKANAQHPHDRLIYSVIINKKQYKLIEQIGSDRRGKPSLTLTTFYKVI
ncbi:MAG: hypothetical protein LBQ47_07435 [Endomicrobium sp.]|nr:hypothetical protein [Endomicrobium sp.]